MGIARSFLKKSQGDLQTRPVKPKRTVSHLAGLFFLRYPELCISIFLFLSYGGFQ